MKEQIYCLKSKLAVSEDTLRRYKQNEWAEIQRELAETKVSLESALSEMQSKNQKIMTLDKKLIDFESKISKYENELLGLSEEKEYWKSIANQPNQYEVSHVADDIIEKFRENEKARIRAQEDAEYYRSKWEEMMDNIHTVKDKLEETDSLKLQQTLLKGEYGDIEIQLQRKEEQVKSSNKRFMYIQKKIEKLSKDNKTFEVKNKELENDRKKLSEKYQNLVNRVKGEEKLKAKIKEYEDSLEAAGLEIESLLERLRDSLKRTEEVQNQLANEQKQNENTRLNYNKLKIQEKLMQDERELLANMNREQSIKINLLEEEVCKTTSPQKQSHEIHNTPKKNTKETQILLRLNKKLEQSVARLESELSYMAEKLQKKEAEVIDLELKLNESHRERRKLEQRQREIPRDSISGLIKCLDRETEYPISALNNNTELVEMNEKYDRLLDKYQIVEEAKNGLEKQLVNVQQLLKSLKTQINEDQYKSGNSEKAIAERDYEIQKLREKISILEDKIKYYGIVVETERHLHRDPSRSKIALHRGNSLHNLTERNQRSRVNTPDDATTPRYHPVRSNSLLKLRIPSQNFDKDPWKF